jgi:glutamate synthase (NADPH/NADH) small chain
MPRPPDRRAPGNPWPEWANIFRVSPAHEEGGARVYSISTDRFLGDAQGRVRALQATTVARVVRDGRVAFEPVPGSTVDMEADLVLLAMGFLGPEPGGVIGELGVKLTERGNVWTDEHWMTSVPGVFTAGDMQRGQSLIVWAIAEGRSAAQGVDAYLMGRSELPAPVAPLTALNAR